MAPKPDGFSPFDSYLASLDRPSPWMRVGDSSRYAPNFVALEEMLTLAREASLSIESGSFPNAVDAWIAEELRRAGFSEDRVWPRASRPRVIGSEVLQLLNRMRRKNAKLRGIADDVEALIADGELTQVGSTNAKLLGRVYEKQVDAGLAGGASGPEILISTKTMSSSFGKNLKNRFEESYGDMANLRARYPLAALGYLFLMNANVLEQEPGAWERAKDMMRKLRHTPSIDGYTATGLMLFEVRGAGRVNLLHEPVPADLKADRFIECLVEHVFSETPSTEHVRARELFEGRHLPDQDLDD